MKRIGLYAGSFDPFTIGHADIVSRVRPLVDELIILIAQNVSKNPFIPIEERLERLGALYASDSGIHIDTHVGITAHYAREVGATVLVRGARNLTDMEYERTLADTNLSLLGMDTIILFTKPSLGHVSSSLVRELAAFGEPYDHLLPY